MYFWTYHARVKAARAASVREERRNHQRRLPEAKKARKKTWPNCRWQGIEFWEVFVNNTRSATQVTMF